VHDTAVAALVVAIAGASVGAIGLGLAWWAWVRVRRVRDAQRALVGGGRKDLVDFAVSLQGRIDDLHRAVDEVVAGLAGGLIAIFLAYLIGGYAAGRMARFNGALNGLGVVIWTIIIALLLGVLGAALGSSFNVGSQLNLHISATNVTIAGIISLAVALVVMSLAAILGGMLGAGYHRAIDRDAGIS